MSFFELRTPRDMLSKARREYERLQSRFDIDNVFNFFVTAYHIQDYVENNSTVPEHIRKAFLVDQDLKDCRDLCDKGKHLKLTRRPYHDPTTVIWSVAIGGAPLNEIEINGGDKWLLAVDGRYVDVQWLAERVLKKWQQFFAVNKL